MLTDTSEIKDSIHIKFYSSIPTIASQNLEFPSQFADAGYLTPAKESKQNNWEVDIVPSSLAKLLIENTKDGSDIEVEDFEISSDETIVLYCIGRDIYNNFIDSVIQVNWAVGNNIGTFSPQNPTNSINFNPRVLGSGNISISNGNLTDQTGLINVTAGTISYLKISNGPSGVGEEIGDIVITSDTLLTLYASGYDSDSNYVMDEKVDWTSTFHSHRVLSNSSYLEFKPTEANDVGKIIANNLNDIVDSTGTISIINSPIIEYIKSSLSPELVTIDQDTAFSISVKNTGDVGVELDTQTYLWFEDSLGNHYNSNLLENTLLSPDSIVLLSFETSSISKTFLPGNYTPIINAIGLDSRNRPFTQDRIPTEFNGLTIAAISIDRINVKRIKPLTQGQDRVEIEISMIVSNHSDIEITNVEGSLDFNGSKEFIGFNTKSISTIPQGGIREFLFTGRINSNSVPNIYLVDGYVSGQIDGLFVFDSSSTIKDSLIISAPPYFNNSFLDPPKVTTGQLVQFELTLINSGGTGLTLYPDSSFLICTNSDTTLFSIQIEDTMKIPAISQKSIMFNYTLTKQITPRMVINGIDDNGFEFHESIKIIPDIVFIQEPPFLEIYDNSITPQKTTQGSEVSFSIEVNNYGGNPAIVSIENSRIRFGNSDTSYIATLNNNSVINNNQVGTIQFGYSIIPDILPVGRYKMDIILDGADENGKSFFYSYTTEREIVEVQTPPNIKYDNFTNLDTLTIGDSFSLSVNVRNTGQTSFSLDSTNSFITINDESGLESQMYIAQLKNDIVINAEQQNLKLDFLIQEVPHQFLKGRYPIQLDLAGWDSNLNPFQQNDILADSISVLNPPRLEYISNSLSNNSIFITDSVQFSLKVVNSGDTDIELSDYIKLVLGDNNLQEFACTSPRSIIHSQDTANLYFEKDSLELAIGRYNAFLFLEGRYLDSMIVSQKINSIEDVYVIIEDPPLISSIRYIDGGYNNIPDGKIDSTDLILVKFTENVAANSRIGNDANDYFTIVSESDFFSSEGFSSVVTTAGNVGYYGLDADSILFVDLNGSPVLATNSASNRDEYIRNSIRRTIIKAEFSPTHFIINQNIKKGLIMSDSGNDIGLDEYRMVRTKQLEEINNYEPGLGYFSKFAVVVDDGIPPHVINFYPSENQNNVSQFTNIKAFITGRNLIELDTLENELNKIFPNDVNLYLNNYNSLLDSLRNYEGVESLKEFFIAKLETYSQIQSSNSLKINPLSQMYENVLFNNIKYYISETENTDSFIYPGYQDESLSFSINESVENESIESSFTLSSSVMIKNKRKLEVGQRFVKFIIPTILDTFSFPSTFTISGISEELKTDRGYVILAAPNPIKSEDEVLFQYELPEDVAQLKIVIIDAAGRIVNEFIPYNLSKGKHSLDERWNRKNLGGRIISRGIYLALLKINESEVVASFVMAVQ